MRYILISLLILTGWEMGCKSRKGVGEAEVAVEAESLPGEAIELQLLTSGSYCGMDATGQYLINTQAAWEKLWKEFSANRLPSPPSIAVDFEAYSVVACFMGAQSTGGHKVVLENARINGSTLYLQGYHQHPGRYCVSSTAIVQPYLMALIPTEGITQLAADFYSYTQDCQR